MGKKAITYRLAFVAATATLYMMVVLDSNGATVYEVDERRFNQQSVVNIVHTLPDSFDNLADAVGYIHDEVLNG